MSTPRFNVDPLSDSFIRLIDIIFGLTITQGFVIYRNIIVSPDLSITSLSLVLVYATIILSWIYYHKSVANYPYNKSRWSRVRLFLDLIILLFYAYLVFVGQDLPRILVGLVAIFSVYSIDGIVRIAEWHDKKVSKPWLSCIFAIIFFEEWYVFSLKEITTISYAPWAILFVSLGLIFGYRFIRSKLGYPAFLVVGVDVDGVLGEQVPPVLKRIQNKGKGGNLTKDSITEWNYSIEGRDISEEIEEALLDPSFVEEMPIVNGSKPAMDTLYKRYHVVIVTSRPIETEQETKKWLRKNFRFHEFINTRECGKNGLGLDILIDDNLENVKNFASSKCVALLFSQPWNRQFKDENLENLISTKRVIRCKDWNEVMKSISGVEQRLTNSK